MKMETRLEPAPQLHLVRYALCEISQYIQQTSWASLCSRTGVRYRQPRRWPQKLAEIFPATPSE